MPAGHAARRSPVEHGAHGGGCKPAGGVPASQGERREEKPVVSAGRVGVPGQTRLLARLAEAGASRVRPRLPLRPPAHTRLRQPHPCPPPQESWSLRTKTRRSSCVPGTSWLTTEGSCTRGAPSALTRATSASFCTAGGRSASAGRMLLLDLTGRRPSKGGREAGWRDGDHGRSPPGGTTSNTDVGLWGELEAVLCFLWVHAEGTHVPARLPAAFPSRRGSGSLWGCLFNGLGWTR